MQQLRMRRTLGCEVLLVTTQLTRRLLCRPMATTEVDGVHMQKGRGLCPLHSRAGGCYTRVFDLASNLLIKI